MAKLTTCYIDRGKKVYGNVVDAVYRYAPTLRASATVIFMHLFLSGDVELNPGPKDGKLMYSISSLAILLYITTGRLTLEDMGTVLTVLWDARPKWYYIGIQLGVKVPDLDVIKEKNLKNADECITELLNKWLRQANPPPTWNSIVKALQSPIVDLPCLAETIEDGSQLPRRAESDTHHTGVVKHIPLCQGSGEVAACDTFQHISKFHELSEKQREQFEMRLTMESENIQLSFHTLRNKFFNSLDALQLSTKKLVRHLKDLKALKKVNSPKSASLMRSYEYVLENFVGVESVKDVIEEYSTFFDFRPLEYMIENVGQEDDKKWFKKYKEDFESYIKHRVFECPVQVGPAQTPNSTELYVKLESDYDKLVDLKQFECRLSFILEVLIHVLRLSSIDKGCIQLLFLIPTFFQKAIFPLSPEQEAALKELGIIKLSCGNYQFPVTV